MEKIIWSNKRIKISELKPFEGNPRQANEKEVTDLNKSLDRFNLADPLVINTDGEVIGGNFRLKLLQEKGIKEVDVRIPNRELTRKEAEELNLRLNKNQGVWNFDMLANFDEGLLKDVGFGGEELDKIFGLEKEDEIPELPKKAKSKKGEIYQLGKHRLMCGDSTKEENIKKLINGKTIQLCFTSPPYNMAGEMYKNYADNLKSKKFIDLHLIVLNNVKKYLKGFIFWNVSYNKNARWEFLEILYRIVKESGLRFLELIIWDKGHALPITSKEMLTREYGDILLIGNEENFKKDIEVFSLATTEKKACFNKKTQKGITNYWRIGTQHSQRKELKACFPVALPKRGIALMTNREENVIDPFGGSGSTLIACEQLNRKCFMMEIDPRYCDVVIERWEKLTREKAIKLKGS